jgi:hypothetical protein
LIEYVGNDRGVTGQQGWPGDYDCPEKSCHLLSEGISEKPTHPVDALIEIWLAELAHSVAQFSAPTQGVNMQNTETQDAFEVLVDDEYETPQYCKIAVCAV